MARQFRRVVTGHDANGKAVVVSDGPPPFLHVNPNEPDWYSADIWRTGEMPGLPEIGTVGVGGESRVCSAMAGPFGRRWHQASTDLWSTGRYRTSGLRYDQPPTFG